MKKLLIIGLMLVFLFVLFFARSIAQGVIGWGTIYATNASTSVPTNFTAGVSATTNIMATLVTVIGKSSARGINSGTVYVGITSGNDTQPYPIAPGVEVVMRAPEGKVFNLKEWWFDVDTANDGLTIIFQ